MQDSKNLKKKINIDYPKLIKEALEKDDLNSFNFWTKELEIVKKKLETRNKNRRKRK